MSKKLSEMTKEELWRLFPIILKEHNTEYYKWYVQTAAEIAGVIGKEHISRINHIGSTAVPGLTAKPTVDILLELNQDAAIGQVSARLETAGWICMSEEWEPEMRIAFNKGYTEQGFAMQVFHLHVCRSGNHGELYFRDYLQSHPETAAAYSQLKQELKERFEHDRDAYTQGKNEFVQKVTGEARRELNDCYSVYEVAGSSPAAELFTGWKETMIWSCLQERMGRMYVDQTEHPKSALIIIADFYFFAGEPSESLVRHIAYYSSGAILMVPQHDGWAQLIEQVHGERAERFSRYSIKKEPDVFDRDKLSAYTRNLPEGYELKLMDEEYTAYGVEKERG